MLHETTGVEIKVEGIVVLYVNAQIPPASGKKHNSTNAQKKKISFINLPMSSELSEDVER